MRIAAKICGLNDEAGLAAALEGGAALIGFNFYPPSPRAVSPGQAAALAVRVPAGVRKVAVLVDPDDDTLASVTGQVPVDLVQLHGREMPERVAEVRALCGRPVIKALSIAGPEDLGLAAAYDGAAEMLLFDARPPKAMAGALPGGNGVAFDWRLLAGLRTRLPWMLSGGLHAGNVAEAVRISGARAVDVSSGVESAPGRKDPAAIRAFLDAVRPL